MSQMWMELKREPLMPPVCELCPEIEASYACQKVTIMMCLSFSGTFPTTQLDVCATCLSKLEDASELSKEQGHE